MKKYLLTISLVALFLFPVVTQAAYNDVQFTEDASIYLSSSDATITIGSGSLVESIEVGTNSITFIGRTNSTITLTSTDKFKFTSTYGTLSLTCNTSNSVNSFTWTESATMTLTPNGSCSQGGGSGNPPPPPPPPSMPVTTTGQVTATSSLGGKTTYTNPNGGSVVLTVPAGAVSVDTTFKVQSSTISDAGAVPENYLMVANQIYKLTAIANNNNVSSFSKAVNLVFTYTDSQLGDFSENTIIAYYYDSVSQKWVAVSTIANTANNQATINVDHFTIFSLMGKKQTEEEKKKEEKKGEKWTPPAGYEKITDPSKIKLYKNIIKEPGTARLYGMLKSGWVVPTGYEYIAGLSKIKLYKNIIKEPGTGRLYGMLKSKWTPPAGYQYITSISRIKFYKNVIKDPNTGKLYGKLK